MKDQPIIKAEPDRNIVRQVKNVFIVFPFQDCVSCYVFRVTCYMLRVTCYVFRVTCYVLRVTCYVLRVTGAEFHFVLNG